MNIPPIIQVGDVLVSPDVFTECFCCDLDACHGACCVEGDAGAPVTLDEIAAMEDSLDTVWGSLSAGAQAVIDRQGVACTDPEGELVTSIVGGRDCVFTCHEDGCCLCALERACRAGLTDFCKPVSCALYPLREKTFAGGLVGLNYNRWEICRAPSAALQVSGGAAQEAVWRAVVCRAGGHGRRAAPPGHALTMDAEARRQPHSQPAGP